MGLKSSLTGQSNWLWMGRSRSTQETRDKATLTTQASMIGLFSYFSLATCSLAPWKAKLLRSSALSLLIWWRITTSLLSAMNSFSTLSSRERRKRSQEDSFPRLNRPNNLWAMEKLQNPAMMLFAPSLNFLSVKSRLWKKSSARSPNSTKSSANRPLICRLLNCFSASIWEAVGNSPGSNWKESWQPMVETTQAKAWVAKLNSSVRMISTLSCDEWMLMVMKRFRSQTISRRFCHTSSTVICRKDQLSIS